MQKKTQEKSNEPKVTRYAFIDAQNTASTTRKLLGFLIDWSKLCGYLKESWKCEKVFLYSGIDEGDSESAKEFESLAQAGGIRKPGINTKRLSTRLKDVIKQNQGKVHLINIDSWKLKIQKTV